MNDGRTNTEDAMTSKTTTTDRYIDIDNLTTCRFSTLRSVAERIEAGLEACAPKATCRRLDSDDIDDALRAHRTAVQRACDSDVEVYSTARGGFVPNSYRYRASADEVRISTNIETGRARIRFMRTHAQSASYGDGSPLVTRARKDGQSIGRVVGD